MNFSIRNIYIVKLLPFTNGGKKTTNNIVSAECFEITMLIWILVEISAELLAYLGVYQVGISIHVIPTSFIFIWYLHILSRRVVTEEKGTGGPDAPEAENL